jgi:hypothetical protein
MLSLGTSFPQCPVTFLRVSLLYFYFFVYFYALWKENKRLLLLLLLSKLLILSIELYFFWTAIYIKTINLNKKIFNNIHKVNSFCSILKRSSIVERSQRSASERES